MERKKTGILGVVITTIILIIIVFVTNIDTSKSSFIEKGVSAVIMPIQNGLTYLKNKISGNDDFFKEIGSLKNENEELKNKNSELEQSLRELEIIKAENTTLKEYVNLKEKYKDYESIPAYIISKNISNYSGTYIINVGSKDGIETNMTVISDKGLIGHVVSVTDTTSKVQTIIDTANSVSVLVSNSNVSALCRGVLKEKTLKATYIDTDASLVEGDTVETSGMGGIYPKGIKVGTISKVINTQNSTNRYAIIQPAVDFNEVETVLVIK